MNKQSLDQILGVFLTRSRSKFRLLVDSLESRPVDLLVAFIDIRGFCHFTQSTEGAADSAYSLGILKLFYATVGGHFMNPEPSSDKLLGDGIVMFWELGNDPASTVASVVRDCFTAGVDFSKACSDKARFPLDAPSRLAVSVARGHAARLSSPGVQLPDYIGYPVNIASRLLNHARPEGIIVSHTTGVGWPILNTINGFIWKLFEIDLKGYKPHQAWVTSSLVDTSKMRLVTTEPSSKREE